MSQSDLKNGSGTASDYLGQLENLEKQPRRPVSVHWGAFVMSVVSFLLLVIWAVVQPSSFARIWLWVDTGISAFFLIEFFTRSGFRWNPARYLLTHIFDFIATVPALLLANYGVAFEGFWLWFIVAARFVRAVDRLLGDGFFRRNTLALLEGFEEEITDRVMLRIISRVQTELGKSDFAGLIAEILDRNKSSVLDRVRSKHVQRGIIGGLANVTKLNAALERGELLIYNAIVDVLKSPEVDNTIREAISSIFLDIRTQIGVKTWRQHLGIR